MLSNDNQYSDNDDVPYWEFIYGHGDILNNVFSMLVCPTCYCKLKKSKHYEVNRRMVYVMRRCGLGYYGMKIFLTLMNHPPPVTEKNYHAINSVFYSATKKVTETVTREAKDELRTNDNG